MATRPTSTNGLGLDRDGALRNTAAFRRHAALYEETAGGWEHLRKRVATRELSGKRIHDANVVATMLAHGLSKLVTAISRITRRSQRSAPRLPRSWPTP